MAVDVGIIMGSQSDWPTMKEAARILDELGVPYETKIVSAHRTPDRLWTYGKEAAGRLKVIIAGAGGAAHLPGSRFKHCRHPARNEFLELGAGHAGGHDRHRLGGHVRGGSGRAVAGMGSPLT